MSAVGYALGLAAVWVMLWGTASPANVLSGLLVGAILVLVLPGLRGHRRPPAVRPRALVRLAGSVVAGSVRSNVLLTKAIVIRRAQPETSIVEVPLPVCSDELVTVITSLLSITPGSMPLELRTEPRRLVVHVLHLEPIERSRRSVEELIQRCLDAFEDRPPAGAPTDQVGSGR